MSKPLKSYRAPRHSSFTRQQAWDRITGDTWTAAGPGVYRAASGVTLRKITKEEYKSASRGNCTTSSAYFFMAYDTATDAQLRDADRGYPVGGSDLHDAIDAVSRYQRNAAKVAAAQP